ncbi:recombinase family protein [Streptomyces sp. NPDC059002]|uniref:recombinase family protein n=1 Tax=Streptomyces sp. NPDC059002 TaxID=3346690 RepID=UPI003686B08C
MTSETTLLGREYLRVSNDRDKQRRSVTEQHGENVAATAEHGITLGAPYDADNDKSASKFATKRRADFEQLISDLRDGSFGAQVLVLWENSRGSRKVSEWAVLIELLEETGVLVFITTDDRLYDPSRPADRKVLQSGAIDSEQEALRTSTRTRRTAAAEAAKGRPHGRPPYGFQREYDAKTGRLITWIPDTATVPDSDHPEGMIPKSEVPVELFNRLKGGHSLTAIAQDWKRRGIVNGSGDPFASQHLRSMALKVAYIGKRVHRGTVVNGTWNGLLKGAKGEATFYAVQRMLAEPGRAKSRNGRAKHEISRIIKCYECDAPMKAIMRPGKGGAKQPRYQCAGKGCTRVDKAGVDEVVIGAMLAYLASDKVYADFTASPDDAERADSIRVEVAELRLKLDEMENATPEDLHEAKVLARSTRALTEKIQGLESEERQLMLPDALQDLIEPGADVAKRWDAVPITARRAVARLLLSPGVLGEVRIQRVGSGVKADAVDRIEWKRDR